MANQGRWSTPGSITTLMSTELNGLAANVSALSSAYDNTTNLDMYADFEIFFATGFSGVSDNCAFLHICEAVDGTNFASPTGSPAMGLFSAAMSATTGSIRTAIRNVQIPPAKFKILFSTNLASLNATGNTLKIIPYSWNTQA